MLGNDVQNLLTAVLALPTPQQYELIDAILHHEELAEPQHRDTPPMTERRVIELVEEGKTAMANGDGKSFDSPKALADHVSGIFDSAIARQKTESGE